jgi:hypothetical protein
MWRKRWHPRTPAVRARTVRLLFIIYLRHHSSQRFDGRVTCSGRYAKYTHTRVCAAHVPYVPPRMLLWWISFPKPNLEVGRRKNSHILRVPWTPGWKMFNDSKWWFAMIKFTSTHCSICSTSYGGSFFLLLLH